VQGEPMSVMKKLETAKDLLPGHIEALNLLTEWEEVERSR
jgi:hypothetical protein